MRPRPNVNKNLEGSCLGNKPTTEERSFSARHRLLGTGALLFASIVIFLALDLSQSLSGAYGQETQAPMTIVELQPFRETGSIKTKNPEGQEGLATLINLNPNVNAWYLLRLSFGKEKSPQDYHLQNMNPQTQNLLLGSEHTYGIIIAEGENRYACELWGKETAEGLKRAKASGIPYAPLCGGTIYLRNPAKGHRTKIEMVTDFLRDEIPAGEKIVTIVRDRFFADAYREKAKTAEDPKSIFEEPSPGKSKNGPASAWLDPRQGERVVVSSHLGIEIQKSFTNEMIMGDWYPVNGNPGINISLIMAKGIAPEILRSYTNVVSGLDKDEAEALAYIVAFDLDKFDFRYALGTDHPRVNWSDHILDRMKDNSLPGPDGIGTIVPLVSTGLINPKDRDRMVATFTGGFKRAHGAFRWGNLALKNHGSHYGFIENGVVFSKLQPGLSTIYVLDDGQLDMKTWAEEDNRLLSKIKFARQNGVPILTEVNAMTQMSVPGSLVSRWGEGNWAGSEDKKLRTMRAGAALQEVNGKRFLLYAVFTGATPAAMTRVFQAYRCRYAMLLDMNALEHTYLAIYKRQGSALSVQHLIRGMSEADKSLKGERSPRFLAYPDDRDFFYILRKERS
jgi:hypothetical protein